MHSLVRVDPGTQRVQSFLAGTVHPLQNLAKDEVPTRVQADLQYLLPILVTVIHAASVLR